MVRTFGVEIEAFGNLPSTVARKLTDAGIPCVVEGYNHQVRAHWKVVSDGSVQNNEGDSRNCYELVSPILSGEDGLRQLRIVMETLTRMGAKVNRTCGLHVHVGAGDLSIEHFRRVARCFVVYEDFFDAIMPASRRASSNMYVRSNRHSMSQTGRPYQDNYVEGSYDAKAARIALRKIDACDTIDEIIAAVNPGANRNLARDGSARYHKLNMTAFWQHGTIEFRQHSGTVDADKAVNWVKLLLAFVDNSRRYNFEGYSRDMKPEIVFKSFFKLFKIADDVQTFYRGRHALLHGANAYAE